MSFKLKYTPDEGPDIELDFEELYFDGSGGFILVAEDKVSGQFYRFKWRSLDIDPTPEDIAG